MIDINRLIKEHEEKNLKSLFRKHTNKDATCNNCMYKNLRSASTLFCYLHRKRPEILNKQNYCEKYKKA